MHGIASWISLPLVYREVTGVFLMLIFYLATLPKMFISSKNVLAESLGTFTYGIISSANKDNWISSFPSHILVISFLVLLL